MKLEVAVVKKENEFPFEPFPPKKLADAPLLNMNKAVKMNINGEGKGLARIHYLPIPRSAFQLRNVFVNLVTTLGVAFSCQSFEKLSLLICP